MAYRILRSLLRTCLWFFFRRIEVEGIERVPRTGPVLLMPNHVNAMIDPLVILAKLDRPMTLTAKATFRRNWLLAPLFRLFGVVTFNRAADQDGGMRKNVESMKECRRRLAQGGLLCIFPEGQSHSDHQLRAFKDGPARIALGYLKDRPANPHLAIIPVGLHFEHKDRLQTRVWVRFGQPIYADEWRAANPEGNHRGLTADIQQGVRDVTLNFESQQTRSLLYWTAEVFATGAQQPATLGQERESLSQRLQTVARLQVYGRQLREERPEEIASLAARLHDFQRKLRRLAITPGEVYLSMHPARAAFFVLREAELGLVGLPLAAWGLINHLPALAAVRAIERKMTKAEDQWASNTFFPALGIFPLFFVIQLALVSLFFAPFWIWVYAVSVPFAGVYLTMYHRRVGGVFRRSRTFLYFLFHPSAQRRLMDEGREIVGEIQRLSEAPELAAR